MKAGLMAKLLFYCLFVINSAAVYATPLIVRFHQSATDAENPLRQYYSELLKVALEETQREFGDYQLQAIALEASQGRSLKVLEQGGFIDVHWSITSKAREDAFNVVYIPLLKGLGGYRVLLICKEKQIKLDQIQTLAELKQQISLGQGLGWPDAEILVKNGFNVVLANSENLHSMLLKNRFDAFPRAVTEAWRELDYHPDFTVDTKLLLHYISPMYFFVKKGNDGLSRRLETGLKIALKNGKFDQLFFKHRAPQSMFDLININSRKIFILQNPDLSEKTLALTQQKQYWLFPYSIN